MKTLRIIITGGPCTGKSSIINALKERGYRTYLEVARAEIKKQLEKNSNLVPWSDVQGFSHLVMQGQLQQYESAMPHGFHFYDRGVPDLVAYLRLSGIDDHCIEVKARDLQYFSPVFIAPPWPAIYRRDEERRESLEEMMAIHQQLKQVYRELGYRVLELPLVDTDKRIEFIFDYLPKNV